MKISLSEGKFDSFERGWQSSLLLDQEDHVVFFVLFFTASGLVDKHLLREKGKEYSECVHI